MSTPDTASLVQQISDLRGVITRQATELDTLRAPGVNTDRPFITLPADQPDYEDLVELTLAQRAELPGRFHTPVWLDAIPGAFVCTVCWAEDEVTAWPCKPAIAAGRHLFSEPHDTAPVAAPQSTEDTPPAPEPRVWRKLDDEPDESVNALAQVEGAYWPYVRRAPFGGWYFSSDASGPNTTGKGSPWHWVLSKAEGPLTEVSGVPTPGGTR